MWNVPVVEGPEMDPVAEFTANESESWNSGIGSGWWHLDRRVVALSQIDAPALEAGGRCLCAGIVNANAHGHPY